MQRVNDIINNTIKIVLKQIGEVNIKEEELSKIVINDNVIKNIILENDIKLKPFRKKINKQTIKDQKPITNREKTLLSFILIFFELDYNKFRNVSKTDEYAIPRHMIVNYLYTQKGYGSTKIGNITNRHHSCTYNSTIKHEDAMQTVKGYSKRYTEFLFYMTKYEENI